MISLKQPQNFKPKFEVSSCFVQNQGKIILLHRQDHKAQGGTWGIPAGKVKQDESPLEAVCREIAEETGLAIPQAKLVFFAKLYVSHYEYDLIFNIFHTHLPDQASIKTNPSEHKDSQWITPNDALSLPLIHDLEDCIRLFFKI